MQGELKPRRQQVLKHKPQLPHGNRAVRSGPDVVTIWRSGTCDLKVRNIVRPLNTFVQVDIPHADAGGRVFDARPGGVLGSGLWGGRMNGGYVESWVRRLRPERGGA